MKQRNECVVKQCGTSKAGLYGTEACRGCKVWEDRNKDDGVEYLKKMFGLED